MLRVCVYVCKHNLQDYYFFCIASKLVLTPEIEEQSINLQCYHWTSR